MKNRVLLRRGSEILAAVVIIVSIIIYSFAAISGIADQSGPEAVNASAGDQMAMQAAEGELENYPSNEISDTTHHNEGDQSDEIVVMAEKKSSPQSLDSMGAMLAAAASNGLEKVNNNVIENEPVTEDITQDVSAETATVQKAEDIIQEPVYKYVQIDSLNVRSGPGSDNEKLGTLEKGSRVQVLQQEEDWLQVITPNDVKGYVFAEYTADTMPPVYNYVTVDLLNVRSGASSDTDKLGTLPKGTRIQVLEKMEEWIRISTPDNVKGYVWAEYVSDKAPTVYNYVNITALNVRKGPSSDTKKLTTLQAGERIQFLESKGDWSKIKTSNNIEGYVYSKYVSAKPVSRSDSSGSVQPHNPDLASQVLEYAKKYVGVKYVYGGESPKGFDCSGFTQYVFAHFKIKLPRSAAEYYSVGTKISRSDMKPGDILLFDRWDDWTLGHVGIYMGNDKFIHASSSKGKVVIASLSKYGGNILGIRRVLK